MLGTVASTSVSPVFVGRSLEMARFLTALREADEGTPGVVLVGGEAGVGKTRLLQEFLERAEAQGAVTAVGGCLELGAESLPFAPISAALRTLSRRIGPELAEAVAGRERDLAWLLPDLAPGAIARDGEFDRVRLFELMLGLLERLGGDRTLVIAIEDLHWADSSTRELLGFLFRLLRTGRILIVGTYRADAVGRRHPLRSFLAELDRVHNVSRIDLARLTRAQVGEQLRGILREDPPRRLTRQIFQKSEGNAFFVEELACSIRDGQLTGISDTLRDLLLIRIEELSEDTQKVIRLAAIGGVTVGHRLLTEVSWLDPDRLEEALRTAVSAHVLVPVGEEFQFRHSLVRTAIREDLMPGERVRLYATFAEALERCPDMVAADELRGRIATYWFHAGKAVKALPAVLAAAEAARERYAFDERTRLLERALLLWEQVPDPEQLSGRRLLDIYMEAVTAARLGSERELAIHFCKRAIQLVDPVAEPELAAFLWREKARGLRNLCRSSGRPELRRAQQILEGLPPSMEQARVLAHIARDRMLDGEGSEAIAEAMLALERARTVDSPDIEAEARKTLACGLVQIGRIEEGMAQLALAEEGAIRSSEPDSLVHILSNKASLLEGLGRHRESAVAARRAMDIAGERGLTRTSGSFALGNLAESLLSAGDWADLETLVEKTLDLDPGPQTTRHLELQLVDLCLARGDVRGATAHLKRSRLAAGSRYVEAQYAIPLARAEIRVAEAQGRLDESREALVAALEGVGCPPGHQRYMWQLLADAAANEADARTSTVRPRESELKARQDIADRIEAMAGSLAVDCALDAAYASLVKAELARAAGTDDAELWGRVVCAWELTEQPYRTAWARFRHAETLLAAGDRDAAALPLATAAEVAVLLDAKTLRELIDLLTRRARMAPTAQGDPGTPLPTLTPREIDVLRLVADGRSNRQIAEELYISVKTASVHVSNILAKLEVTGRGEAAAVAHRLHLVDG
ncbi:helix-turn-helix transcriptional regulator [Embleya scabrispora]|uniref:helix-turn-helix transcriptional regulator n=1 Tax=Embleya scabrispora TaxID=159449 RepID=UPI00047582F1|nr:helix-turn-helix transcriptional regulator [Embleya scabrispora]MYS80206.1 AAA family ATPase [Streptomyces sp. SID5474]